MAMVSQCKYHQPVGLGERWELFCLSTSPRACPLPDLTCLSPHTSPLWTVSQCPWTVYPHWLCVFPSPSAWGLLRFSQQCGLFLYPKSPQAWEQLWQVQCPQDIARGWMIPNPAAMHLLPASPWEPCHRTNFQVHITVPASIPQSPQTFQTLRILSPFSPGKSSSTGESMPLAPEWALELWPPLIMLALSIYLREALILWPKPS